MTKNFQEHCPLTENVAVILGVFNHHEGTLTLQDYAVKVSTLRGAIAYDPVVEIKLAASLFGSFVIPMGYHPISALCGYLGACYEFNKNILIEIEHHSHMVNAEDISNLCVLKACESDVYP